MPATGVSWYDVFYFTVFMANARVTLPDGIEYRFRIPSEAQGEYATRAGSTGDYFIDRDRKEVTKDILGFYAVFGNTQKLAVNTKSKKPNRWKLMHPVGNVLQWRWDYYGRYEVVYPEGIITDPCGPLTGAGRVVRGGSFNSGPANCRSAFRLRYFPSNRKGTLGFRLALSPVGIPRPPEASSESSG
jgi:formylglycine-generating enzyme required for sulfatase activity